MANVFKRIAAKLGRWTGIAPKDGERYSTIPPIADEVIVAPAATPDADADIDAVMFASYLESNRNVEAGDVAELTVNNEAVVEANGEGSPTSEDALVELTIGATAADASPLDPVGEVSVTTDAGITDSPAIEASGEFDISTDNVSDAVGESAAVIEASVTDAVEATIDVGETDQIAVLTDDETPATPWGEAVEAAPAATPIFPFAAESPIAEVAATTTTTTTTTIPAEPAKTDAPTNEIYSLAAAPVTESFSEFQALPLIAETISSTILVPAEPAAEPITATFSHAQVFPEPTPFAEVVTHVPAPRDNIEERHIAAAAPIEIKPSNANGGPSFTKLYKMISAEMAKRTDDTVATYERLLESTRGELEASHKANRIAWSVGGVMTAVAAFGAIYSAGEMSAARVEVASLKQQVTAGQLASVERDQLRSDLMKTREASARVEIDALKARLDQALTVSADRDRLRGELESAKRTTRETEAELRVARAAAATQPVSQAQPAASKVFGDRTSTGTAAPASRANVAGSERPDVWSTLLNGKDDR